MLPCKLCQSGPKLVFVKSPPGHVSLTYSGHCLVQFYLHAELLRTSLGNNFNSGGTLDIVTLYIVQSSIVEVTDHSHVLVFCVLCIICISLYCIVSYCIVELCYLCISLYCLILYC